MKKGFKIVLGSLGGVILVAICSVIGVYWTRLKTISTLKEVTPQSFYTLDFKADYKLDELLSRNLENDQVFVNEALDIMYPLLHIEMEAPPLMCSAFAAETPDGDAVFGRNFDLSQVHCLLIRTTPKDGYRSIGALFPDIVSVADYPINNFVDKMKLLLSPYVIVDGMNEKGLGVAALAVGGKSAHQNSGKPPITTNLALRLLLDKAANVDEAISLLKSYDMRASGGYNYSFFVADATGRSVVIEYYESEMGVIESSVGGNFYLRPDVPEIPGAESVYKRFNIVRDALIEEGGVVDENKAMAILQAAHSYAPDKDGLKSTQWSEVFNLDKQTLKMCVDMDYERVYEFNIADFDKKK